MPCMITDWICCSSLCYSKPACFFCCPAALIKQCWKLGSVTQQWNTNPCMSELRAPSRPTLKCLCRTLRGRQQHVLFLFSSATVLLISDQKETPFQWTCHWQADVLTEEELHTWHTESNKQVWITKNKSRENMNKKTCVMSHLTKITDSHYGLSLVVKINGVHDVSLLSNLSNNTSCR